MKTSFIKKKKNEVEFKLEFTAEEFDKAIDEVYRATKGRYAVDGFRKGKAPRKLIESKYGEDVFYEDAIEKLFREAYPKAIEELKLEPVDSPTVKLEDIKAGKDLEMGIKVTVMPEFDVKDYKGVKVPKVEVNITDEDVQKDLEALQKRNSRMVVVDRPAKEGDTILLDYAGFIGDEQFEGGTAERQPLTLGSNTFIPGFEEQLIGVKAGEEKDVKVTFPEDYHAEDLAGKEAVFKCKVHEVKETELPELDDEFAKDGSEFDTLEELKKSTREKLEKNAKDRSEYETKNTILEKVYEANDIDIPNVMVESQIDEMLYELDQTLSQQGIDLQMYLEYIQKDFKDFREEMREDAYKKVKTKLLVEAVAKKENITASEEEIENEIKAMAEMYKLETEKLKEMMGEQGMAYLTQDIVNRRAINFMFENAVFE
ncbi:MAG: trigger factor [Clostridiales bacterium]|nr:trigger factor [Clostridiales bacterium]